MKDFTTPDYINPVMGELRAFYTPVTDNAVLRALNCNLIMQSNHTRNALVVRAGQPFYYYSTSPAMKQIYKDIEDYANYASTEDGELDEWQWSEKQRVQAAIRDRLIAKYAGGKAA